MSRVQIKSHDLQKTNATFEFENIDAQKLSEYVECEFTEMGYKKESGSYIHGSVGKGSKVLSILFNGYSGRFDFSIDIEKGKDSVELLICMTPYGGVIRKALSYLGGALGGLGAGLREVRFTQELEAITEKMKSISGNDGQDKEEQSKYFDQDKEVQKEKISQNQCVCPTCNSILEHKMVFTKYFALFGGGIDMIFPNFWCKKCHKKIPVRLLSKEINSHLRAVRFAGVGLIVVVTIVGYFLLNNNKLPEQENLEYSSISESSAKTTDQLAKHLNSDPEDVQGLIELGNFYFDNDLHTLAIEAYEKSLTLDPKNVSVLTDLGVMYRRNGNLNKALKCFDKAITLDPKFETAYFNKGVVLYADKNDKAGAFETWGDLLDVNPAAMNPSGGLLREMVESLKKAEENEASP